VDHPPPRGMSATAIAKKRSVRQMSAYHNPAGAAYPSHAHPGGFRQVYRRLMHEFPHALLFRQTLQHAFTGSVIDGDRSARGTVNALAPARRHPAALASPSEQNHCSRFDTVITVLSYQRPPGM